MTTVIVMGLPPTHAEPRRAARPLREDSPYRPTHAAFSPMTSLGPPRRLPTEAPAR
jgi:hypothetical protein